MGGEERPEQRRQEFEGRGRVGQHAHPAAQALGEVAQLAAHRLELLRHQPGVMDQREPGGRGRHAAPLALEQGRAELLLHVADALARRGERQPAARRAMGDAGGVGDVQDQPQVDQVEAHGCQE